MGFSAPCEPPTSNKHHLPRTTGATQVAPRGRSAENDDDATQLAESFDSLASNLQGPSTKRPKSNRRSIILSQAPPKTPVISKSNPPSTIKSSSRHPLVETGFNGPAKSPPNDPPKHGPSEGNHLQDFDLDMDLEFSKDFLFTSTAFSGSNDQAVPQ